MPSVEGESHTTFKEALSYRDITTIAISDSDADDLKDEQKIEIKCNQ
jgi:uncharacterized Fe-S cluster-containing protein